MQHYTVTLDTIGPVYVGNGTDLTKKDYYIEGSYAYVCDPMKLYDGLGKKYEEFIFDTYQTLTEFRYRNKDLAKKIDESVKYELRVGDVDIKPAFVINEFIKDAYGQPYIPGSTLKGVLRTIILADIIDRNPGKYTSYSREPLRYTKIDALEKEAVGAFNESIFRHMLVSDSEPLALDNLLLSRKIDVFKDNQANPKLNLNRESLKPDTQIKFKLSMDSSQSEYFRPERLMQAINNFNQQYHDVFLSKFNHYKPGDRLDDSIYIGGGVGFISKTVVHNLYERRAVQEIAGYLDNAFRKHKHSKDIEEGISPRAKKCTKIDGQVMEMGLCQIRID